MNVLWAVVRKEVRDAVRDRRSLLSALLYPLFGPILIASMFAYMASSRDDDTPLEIPIAGAEHAPALVRALEAAGAIPVPPPADPRTAVQRGDLDFVLEIPEDYGSAFREGRPARLRMIFDSSRHDAHPAIGRAKGLLAGYGRQIGGLRLILRGIDPAVVSPLNIDDVDLATPQKMAGTILGVLPLFVLLAAFVGGMYVAADSTAGERERGSFEPLLGTPARRGVLVTGKWLAASCFATVTVVLTLTSTLAALAWVPLDRLGVALDLGLVDVVGIVIATVPLALLATSLQLLLATFARSFKEAQTYLSLLMMAPMIPAVVLSLEPIQSSLWMMFVPALGQQLLLLDVIRGEPVTAAAFLVAATTALGCAAAGIWFTARLFGRESIIFGR